MGLDRFVAELLETGRVRVPNVTADGAISNEELKRTGETLGEFERMYRKELAGAPPSFDLAAAIWGAGMLYRACQVLVFRDIGEARSASLFATTPPPTNPANIYSVDLTVRFLPDVARLARAANREDPFIQHLVAFAGRWPLSSVGIEGATAMELDGILNHDCLLALYVDRILAARDVSRLSPERVREAVRRAIGNHPELSPEIAAALRKEESPA